MTIQYDGSDFHGWQVQAKGRTVQGDIEAALSLIYPEEKITLIGAGRTDAGVHALGQVAHISLPSKYTATEFQKALNGNLKQDVHIDIVEETNVDFHARFSAKMRTYQYKIINRRSPLTIDKNFAWVIFKKLKIADMKIASLNFLGKHDFNSFRSINCQSSSSIKTIENFEVKEVKDNILIDVSAKSFLHSQVRIMVGTLVEVGKGKLNPDAILKIIKSNDRSKAGPTAPAHGLYVMKVQY